MDGRPVFSNSLSLFGLIITSLALYSCKLKFIGKVAGDIMLTLGVEQYLAAMYTFLFRQDFHFSLHT
jgi:hypothetical protein